MGTERNGVLPSAKQRYFRDIGDGIALGYQRGGNVGTWSVRNRGADARYSLVSLGTEPRSPRKRAS